MSRELPIIFDDESVRAILGGRKTQTRRVIPPRRPRYRVDDLLWVKETWRITDWEPDDVSIGVQFKADNSWIDGLAIEDEWAFDRYARQCRDDAEKAGVEIGEDRRYEWIGEPPTRWRSPVAMPKDAARLWLRVTDVRAERLQDIDAAGIIGEGVFQEIEDDSDYDNLSVAQGAFGAVWDKLNAKKGYPWDSNPWVWVHEFKVERVKR